MSSKSSVYLLSFVFPLLISLKSFSQGEPFSAKREINQLTSLPVAQRYRLSHPFEMLYGPDDSLWVTEKTGRIIKVSPLTGGRRIIATISSVYITISRDGSGVATSIGQDGVLGMALHPNFGKGLGKDSVYIAYCYDNDASAAVDRRIRISAFRYNRNSDPGLTGETTLLQGIPGSNDHNSGRLIIGPDNKLYYTCGDNGANQFGNKCNPIRSQNLPASTTDYVNYLGKVLRINMDGTIPSDNPLLGGIRSHVYTLGHRNPQGLVFEMESVGGFTVPKAGGRLYSSEQGGKVDDELNIITAGQNYGWPRISGNNDNLNYIYYNYSSTGGSCNPGWNDNTNPTSFGITGLTESSASITNFQPPLFRMYTECGSNPTSVCDLSSTNNLLWPTLAPSSVDYYWSGQITGWRNSLLVPTLKKGTLYRYKLNAAGDGIVGDSIPYFRDGNRYRDVAINKDGSKIYLLTDSIGNTSGPTGGSNTSLLNRGAILEFSFLGVLALDENDPRSPNYKEYNVKIYPNPASSVLNIENEKSLPKPIRYALFDMTGKKLIENTSSRDNFQINIRSLKPGVYVLRIFNGFGIEMKTQKVVVN
jgi:aldose sugar dehydrogenase